METLFARFSIEPLRLSYEMTLRQSELETLNMLARHIGINLPSLEWQPSRHKKLRGVKAKEFSARFVAENADFLSNINESRARRIAIIRHAEGTK